MISYSLMSTPSCSASCCALPAGRTLKPTTMADAGLGQVDVRLGDAADAGGDDVDADLLGRQLGERVRERLGRALHVGLEDDLELLDLALLDLVEDVLERHRLVPAQLLLAPRLATVLDQRPWPPSRR